jgi:hypothetical protein
VGAQAQELFEMAKKGPNHPHRRDEPTRNTRAPNREAGGEPPGPSGQATQEQDVKRRIGQFTGAGEPSLIKK